MLPFSRHAWRLFGRTGRNYVRLAPCLFVRRQFASLGPAVVQPNTSISPLTAPLQITLREYQEECIQSVLAYLQKGHKRLGISLATGSGKTVIFTHLIDRIPSTASASQTLVLAHRRELVEQAARHCSLAYPDKHVDIEMGNHHASGAANITVASIQSITSGDRLAKFDPSRYKLVLVDEAHHIVSPSYLELLEHFGLRHQADWTTVSAPALVGVSATFSRFDGIKLGSVIDHIVYHRDYVDMIEENWLSNVIFTTVEMKADLTKIRPGPSGDFQTGALSKAVNTDETNDIVVKTWLARAKERKSTLVFCVDINHVSSLTTKFREYGIEAQYVTGTTPKKIRSARVDAFRNGEFPVLLNCGVFTEGTDIPNIDCVLLARPTKSRNLLVQMIGRGMRLHKGKENCHIIDFVAALSTGVVSTPTLFGLDPAEIVENMDTEEMMALKETKEKEKQREEEAAVAKRSTNTNRLPGTLTFTDYESVHDLIADNSSDQYIRRISELAWVSLGDGQFVLSSNTGAYLVLGPSDTGNNFIVKYYRKLPTYVKSKAPWAAPKVVAEGETFEHALHAADTFASQVFVRLYIAKDERWRNAPASQAQLDFLNKSRSKDEQLKPGEISKGRAQDMITRLLHGMKGRYGKVANKKATEERNKARTEATTRRLQGQVQVGPLSADAAT